MLAIRVSDKYTVIVPTDAVFRVDDHKVVMVTKDDVFILKSDLTNTESVALMGYIRDWLFASNNRILDLREWGSNE